MGLAVGNLVGIPFKIRGRDVHAGIDCIGLMLEVGKVLGHSEDDMLSAFDQRRGYGGENVAERISWQRLDPTDHMQVGDVAYIWYEEESRPHVLTLVGHDQWLTTRSGARSHIARRATFESQGPTFYRYGGHKCP